MPIIGKAFGRLGNIRRWLLFYIGCKIRFGARISIGKSKWFVAKPECRIDTNGSGEIHIGKNCRLDTVRFTVQESGHITIGNNVAFNRNCLVASHGTIHVGDHCSFGPNVCIYDHDHRFGPEGRKEGFRVGTVEIGRNCWFGAGATILRDTKIGDNCVIGAGTLVKGYVPDHSLVTADRHLLITPLTQTDMLGAGENQN